MSGEQPHNQTNYVGGDQIHMTGGTGNVGKIVQPAPSAEYSELVETLRVQIATMLQLDEFTDRHAELSRVQVAFEEQASDEAPAPQLAEATGLLREILSGATKSALAQLVLKNASRLFALIP